MEKLQDLPSKIDDICGNISPQQYQELSNVFKQRFTLLREDNARLEALLTDFKVLNEDIKMAIGNYSHLNGKENSVQTLHANSLEEDLALASHTERLRKHNNYLSKLKTCIKLYTNLNEKLSKTIKDTKSQCIQAKSDVDSILNVNQKDIQQLESKAKKYESDLAKFERKYPWLKDPQFSLPAIAKEVETLRNLKDSREKLLSDLSIYEGLKPDIREASQQLAEIKEEHKQFVFK